MLQGLQIALAQAEAGITSVTKTKKIRQIMYSLYRAKETTKKVFKNVMNSVKV